MGRGGAWNGSMKSWESLLKVIGKIGAEGGDLTLVSSGPLWLQPGEGEQVLLESGGDV